LNICAPWAIEMMISNDGGFGDAQWEPYAKTKPWTIAPYGQYVLPCFVYAAFREANGTVHATYFDDIIYDPNAPSGTISVGNPVGSAMRTYTAAGMHYGTRLTQHAAFVALLSPKDDGTVDLYITASDGNSGVTEMQIGASSAFTDTTWESYASRKQWTPPGGDGLKTVYARFRDNAGNVSTPANAEFVLDTLPPLGGIALGRHVVGPDVITTTVYLGAEDNLSGVASMRVSADPGFGDAAWQVYTPTLTWPVSLTVQGQGAVYVQYRDLAENVSEVYSDTYTVDTAPPVLYVEVAPGDALTRTVTVLAYDALSDLGLMRLTNDPLFVEGVVTMPYSETVTWAFDDRRVVWVQLSDSVGNWTEPYPAYAAPAAVTPEIAIARDETGVLLTWTHAVTNTGYEVWRGAEPYFDPDAPLTDTVKLADVPAPAMDGVTVVYTDTTALVGANYYYLVRGVNGVGQVSTASNRTGIFNFGIEPGAPGAQARESPPEPALPADARRYYLPVLTR
jgi:hypothetical protein